MLKKALKAIAEESSGEKAFENERAIYENDRWSTFPRYGRTAEVCAERMERYGLVDVEKVSVPADGKTRIQDWTMPLAWDAEEAVLEVVEPVKRIVARYTEIPNSLCMWSAPTPEGGVEGKLVFAESARTEELALAGLKGKFVYVPEDPREAKAFLARSGALAVITSGVRNKDLLNAVHWLNVGSDRPGGYMMTAKDSRWTVFSISRNSARELRSLAREGTVRLRAAVKSRLYEGALPYVTARVPGETDEEVIVMGHLYEQGANDNASGTGSILEIGRALNALIASGRLPKPRRSIRLLVGAECYGTIAYADANRERLKRTKAALCLDTGAGRYELEGSLIRLIQNALCARSWADGLAAECVRVSLGKRPWKLWPYSCGTDNYYCDPAIGVPIPWLWGGMGDDYWHCSADSLDKVDPRSYADLVRTSALYLYAAASVGDEDRPWLSALACDLARRNLREEANRIIDRARAKNEARDPGGRLKLHGWCEKRAVSGEWLEAIDGAVGFELARVEAELMRLGIKASPAEEFPDEWSRVAPRRKGIIGHVTLDEVPVEEWKEGAVERSPRWWNVPTCAWWWADGERSLEEIARLVRLEFPEERLELLKLFDFLQKHGYVELAEK